MLINRRLLQYLRAGLLPLLLTILAGVGGGVLILLQARGLSRVVKRVFLEGSNLAQVQPLLGGLLLVMLLRAGAALLGEVSANALAVRVKEALRSALTVRLFQLGPAGLCGEQSGELAAAAAQGIEALDAYFSQYLPQVVLAAAVPLLVLLVVFPLDLLSALVMLLTAPLIPVFMVLIGNAAEALTRRQFTALRRMSAFFLDTLQGLKTLKSLGQSRRQGERIALVSERYRAATMRVLRVTFLSALVLELVSTLSTAVIAVQIGLRLMYGRIGFEEAFFILIIAPDFYQPLRQLGQRFHAGMAGISAARRIFEVMDLQGEQSPDSQRAIPTVAPATINASAGCSGLEVSDLHFRYPERETGALNGVTFSIRPGEHVALVGHSGAGKSTVISLILRFLTPQQGSLRLCGYSAAELGLEEWRDRLAWVPQRPALFHESIAENMRLGSPAASIADLRAAARLAGLEEWIDSLPRGWDTPVGEGGARLSGGQAQRLALARAYLKHAPVLLLDEPTAHLDPENTAAFQSAARALRRETGAAVLTVAHSLQTVFAADRILVLQDGRIVESGGHAELLAQGGAYKKLVRGAAWMP